MVRRELLTRKDITPLNTSSNYINFKDLKTKLDFGAVLEGYGVELKNGNPHSPQRMGFCPLPGHEGERKSPSFSVNLDRGIFHCFGCGAKGNVIEFAAHMEGLDPEDGKQFRQAALLLRDRFLPGQTDNASPSKPTTAPPANSREEAPKPPVPANTEVVVNAPLDFSLTTLKKDHPYLESRGLTPQTAAHFGVGFTNRGYMKGRVAIPLHNTEGELVGYTGRLVDEDAIDADHPKYRFPSKRERDGVLHEFHKSDLLYNEHRVVQEGPVEELIVVEGAFDVMWLWQHGYRNAVALLGSSCSDTQAQRLIDHVSEQGLIWIFTDGDEPGQRCAQELLAKLASHRLVSLIQVDPGKDPCDHTAEELERLLAGTPTALRHAA